MGISVGRLEGESEEVDGDGAVSGGIVEEGSGVRLEGGSEVGAEMIIEGGAKEGAEEDFAELGAGVGFEVEPDVGFEAAEEKRVGGRNEGAEERNEAEPQDGTEARAEYRVEDGAEEGPEEGSEEKSDDAIEKYGVVVQWCCLGHGLGDGY